MLCGCTGVLVSHADWCVRIMVPPAVWCVGVVIPHADWCCYMLYRVFGALFLILNGLLPSAVCVCSRAVVPHSVWCAAICSVCVSVLMCYVLCVCVRVYPPARRCGIVSGLSMSASSHPNMRSACLCNVVHQAQGCDSFYPCANSLS